MADGGSNVDWGLLLPIVLFLVFVVPFVMALNALAGGMKKIASTADKARLLV